MKNLLALILISVVGIQSAWAETFIGVGSPDPLPPLRIPSVLECENLLKSAGNLPLERRAQVRARELLMMLVFTHPILKNAAENTRLSEAELYRLFHYSGGFAMQPPKAGWFSKDPSEFQKLFRWEGPTKNFSRKPKGTDPFFDFWEIIERIRSSKLNHREAVSVQERKFLADRLYATLQNRLQSLDDGSLVPMTYILPGLDSVDWRYRSKFQVVIPPLQFFEQTEKVKFRNLAEDLRLKVYREDAQLGIAVYKSFAEIFIEELPKIIDIRDEILRRAKTVGIRKALTEVSREQQQQTAFLLKDFEDLLSVGTTLSLTAEPEMAPLPPAVLEAFQASGVSDSDPTAVDSLATARHLMRLVEQHFDFGPFEQIDRDISSIRSESDLRKNLPGLQAALSRMKLVADFKAEEMDRLDLAARGPIEAVMTSLENYARELEEKNLSPRLLAARLDEASLLQLGFVQSLTVLSNRHDLQIQWLNLLTQLEALVRNYKNQIQMGGDARDLEQDIVDQIYRMQGMEVPERKPLSIEKMPANTLPALPASPAAPAAPIDPAPRPSSGGLRIYV